MVLQERGRRELTTKSEGDKERERESEQHSQLSLDCLLKEFICIHSTHQPMTNVVEEEVYH